MDVTKGQRVYAPNPEGDGQVLATVIKVGDQADGVIVDQRKRDVVIVEYEKGPRKGFTATVRIDLLSAIGSDPSRRLRLTKEQTEYIERRHAEGVMGGQALKELGLDLTGVDRIIPFGANDSP